MSRATDARTILAEMELGYERPFLRRDIGDWRFSVEDSDSDNDISRLRAHLMRVVTEAIEKVQPETILRPIAEAVDAVWEAPEVVVRDIVFAAGRAYQADVPDLATVSEVSTDAYERMDSSRVFKTAVSKALKTIDRADGWLESVEITVKAFVNDRDVTPKAFASQADRDRFAANVLSDLSIYRKAFERRKAELVKVEGRFRSEVQVTDKALTTVKMFADLVQAEVRAVGRTINGPAPVGRQVQFGAGRTVNRFDAT